MWLAGWHPSDHRRMQRQNRHRVSKRRRMERRGCCGGATPPRCLPTPSSYCLIKKQAMDDCRCIAQLARTLIVKPRRRLFGGSTDEGPYSHHVLARHFWVPCCSLRRHLLTGVLRIGHVSLGASDSAREPQQHPAAVQSVCGPYRRRHPGRRCWQVLR